MKNVLLYLVIFVLFYCCFCTSEEESELLALERYENCTSDSGISFVNLYWMKFGSNSTEFFYQNISLSEGTSMNSSIQLMVSTCICREQHLKPIFFISPYYENDIFEDVYVYCIPGKPQSFGIYDEYEIYDKFLIEHTLKIPNSLMIPLLNEEIENGACLDKNGDPTKMIANQKSCMVSISTSPPFDELEVYSGPLTISVLKNYEQKNIAFNQCYTSLDDTTYKLEDSCIYMHNISTFFCCCAQVPQRCSFNYTSEVARLNGKNLFCASNLIMEYRNDLRWKDKQESLISDYYKHNVGPACGITISTVRDPKSKNGFMFKVDYYATDSCENEIVVNLTTSKYCASENETLINVQIFKCCTNGHFCNMNLTNVSISNTILNHCHYKPTVLLTLVNDSFCEFYYDLTNGVRVYLNQNFTVKIVYETWVAAPVVHSACSYVYGNILKPDSDSCSIKIYNESALTNLQPLLRCLCNQKDCDYTTWEFKYFKQFECQKLKDASFKTPPGNETSINKWICYIQINDFGEGEQISAGHFDVNDDVHAAEVEKCAHDGILKSKFCCVNIVNIKQNNSECTVIKQIARFNAIKAESKDESENSNNNHGTEIKHIHCFSKDIQDSESEHCPLSDGCFSTRTLQTSETSSDDTAIEPAGCLGYAEDYTIKDVPLASVSLGCRVGENSNRCSVVQSPDGQQRVVCCCNQNDENGLCNTNLNKVPEKIGKSVSSFKN